MINCLVNKTCNQAARQLPPSSVQMGNNRWVQLQISKYLFCCVLGSLLLWFDSKRKQYAEKLLRFVDTNYTSFLYSAHKCEKNVLFSLNSLTDSEFSLHSPLFVPKFPSGVSAFTPGLFYLQMHALFSSLYSNRCTLSGEKVSLCLQTLNKSLWNENFPPSFRWQLYVPVSSSGLPVVLWSWQPATLFDSWVTLTVFRQPKGPFSVWSQIRGDRGLKSRRPAGRRSEETQTLARAIVRYTVAVGSHNFSLCVCVFILLSSLSLICAQSVEWLS